MTYVHSLQNFLVITDVASKLLDIFPELANIENEEGLTALQVLAQLC